MSNTQQPQFNKWVRNNGAALEILNFDPTGKWADGAPFIGCPAEIEPWLDSSYSVNAQHKIVPPSLDYLKQQVMAKLAELRYNFEISGVTLPDGTVIKTDRESQAQLASAFTSLKNGLISDTPWKVAPGVFVPVTLDMITPIAEAVAQHVKGAFSKEQAKCAEVMAAATAEALYAYDVNAGWVDA